MKTIIGIESAAKLRHFPSGQTSILPDETMLKCFCSDKTHVPPDGRTLRLAHQNHFVSTHDTVFLLYLIEFRTILFNLSVYLCDYGLYRYI